MDAINSNYSQFAASFASKLGEISQTLGTQATGEVAKEQSVASGTQVRLTESTDKLAYVSAHPELAASANMTAEESQELLQSTSEKVVSTETTCRGNTVMFDIYAILALIQETSQDIRNAQRDLRKAEVESITSSIMAQADMQRTAALTQLISGCVTAGISMTMLAVSAAGMGKNLTQMSARQNAAGLDVMKQQENTLACSDSPTAAKTNFEGIKNTTPPEVKAEVDAAFQKADTPTPTEAKVIESRKADCEAAGKEVAAAEQKFGDAQSKLADLRSNGGGTHEIAAAKTELAAAGKELKSAVAKQDAANQALENPTQNVPEDVAKSISNEKASQLGQVVDQYQADFDKASAKASYELETKGKVSDATKQELKTAGQKLTYARASQVNTCAQMETRPTEYLNSAFKSVSQQTAGIEQHTTVGTIAQQKAQIKYQTTGNLAKVVGDLGASIGSGVAQMFSAEATRMQADQKQAEEDLDQVKDLYNNTQQVIQQSIQLFQSVTSKESQSIEEIIGGIKA